jgi:hypothetical protein
MKDFSASLIGNPFLPTPILWFSGWNMQARLTGDDPPSYACADRLMLRV